VSATRRGSEAQAPPRGPSPARAQDRRRTRLSCACGVAGAGVGCAVVEGYMKKKKKKQGNCIAVRLQAPVRAAGATVPGYRKLCGLGPHHRCFCCIVNAADDPQNAVARARSSPAH
jgi:hypothetical protein